MSENKYSWEGPWDGPGCGYYVICDHDGREMEPHEVVERLDALADLQEQVLRTSLKGWQERLSNTSAVVDDLGRKVKAYRKKRRYSQKELASLAGISRNYLSQIERGETGNISMEIYNRLRKAIND